MFLKKIKNILILSIASFAFSFVVNYNLLTIKNKNSVQKNANKIDLVLNQSFEETENLLISIGKKIIKTYPSNKSILQIFIDSAKELSSDNIFSWSLFDWVNIQGFQTVNTALGIRENPPRVSLERNYLERGKRAWKIIFSDIAIGNPSKILVIPVGVRIEDKDVGRIGVVSLGIEIEKLTNLIKRNIDSNIHFLIVDIRNNKISLSSKDSENVLEEYLFTMPESLNDVKYVKEKEMISKYPYKIWVGYDIKQFWNDVLRYSLLSMIPVIIILIYITFGREFFRK